MNTKIFGTYLYLREDGTPYYVGKFSYRERAFERNNHRVQVPSEKSRILIQEFSSHEDAVAAEIFLIAYYGRKDLGTGCLRNLTGGGEGITGYVHTPETRQRLSLIRKNDLTMMRHIRNLGVANIGKKHSEAFRLFRIGKTNKSRRGQTPSLAEVQKREASRRLNKKVQTNSVSGIAGVRWDKSRQKWLARIRVNRQNIYIGRFVNKHEAVEARIAMENKLWQHPHQRLTST